MKYISKYCYRGSLSDSFYQYTVIDEASRERFIYPFREQSSYSTIQFIKMAIHYFKYKPEIIQTDNGTEFTYPMDTKKEHPFDIYCKEEGILHTLIRPRTPRHNGKVERSHRNDNMQTLGWNTPIEMRKSLEGK